MKNKILVVIILFFLCREFIFSQDTQKQLNYVSQIEYFKTINLSFGSDVVLDSIPENLFHRYVEEIVFDGNPNINYVTILSKLEHKDSLKVLKFANMNITNINSVIKSFQNIQNLEFFDCYDERLDLTQFSKIINDLKIVNTVIKRNEESLNALGAFADLNYLWLKNTLSGYTSQSITNALQMLKKLKSIHLNSILTSDTLIFSNEIDCLDSLFLTNTNFKILKFSNPNSLKQLKVLAIISNKYFDYKIFFKEYSHFLTNLNNLGLINDNIREIPSELFEVKSLTSLELDGNHIHIVSPLIGKLQEIEDISIIDNDIEILPKEIEKIVKLKRIHINFNNIKFLDISNEYLKSMWVINIHNNPLDSNTIKRFEQINKEGKEIIHY